MLPFELRAVEVALNGAVQVRVPYPNLSHRGRGIQHAARCAALPLPCAAACSGPCRDAASGCE